MNLGTAVVTGAAGELGSAMADRLVQDGYRVLAVVRKRDEAQATTHQAAVNKSATVVSADLEDVDSLASIFDGVEDLRLLVNNAAIYPATPFDEVTVDEYNSVIDINQRAYFFMAQHAARSMSPGSSIINVSSITVHGGWEHLAPYVSTKAAAVGLTRALARELGPRGIRVNAISPGAIPTQAERIIPDREAYDAHVLSRQSLKRRGTPADCAACVSFLASEDASFVTGQTLEVDGGWVMT
jgi:NAD(P)-dependent dehydrogenase (short-subunit alcohol dehydrogenase family)